MVQVASVKATIEAQQSFPVTQQKLIHAGKVLKDDSLLSEYSVKENDFLVVMVTKVCWCSSTLWVEIDWHA